MKRTSIQNVWARALCLALLGLSALGSAGLGAARAQGLTRRPLPKLDTSRGLYIKKDGTRLYKNPAAPRNRVFTYKRRDGKTVSTLVGPRRAYASTRRAAKPVPSRAAKKRSVRRRSSSRR